MYVRLFMCVCVSVYVGRRYSAFFFFLLLLINSFAFYQPICAVSDVVDNSYVFFFSCVFKVSWPRGVCFDYE